MKMDILTLDNYFTKYYTVIKVYYAKTWCVCKFFFLQKQIINLKKCFKNYTC